MKEIENNYGNLALMTVLSFMFMYILMYMMVDKFENVISNLNQFYMAGMMTIPMVILELLIMGPMYPSRTANSFILIFSAILLLVFIVFIRQQTAIHDNQFLKSMIPHHASAILMCEKATLVDPEIKLLCGDIITSQQSEIDWMNSKLKKLKD